MVLLSVCFRLARRDRNELNKSREHIDHDAGYGYGGRDGGGDGDEHGG